MIAGPQGDRRRHIIILSAFVAVFICYLDRVSMAVAIVPLAAEQRWTPTEAGAVLSAFFLGYLACQLPAGWAARRYGGRRLIGAALIGWSLMTLLTPPAVGFGLGALIFVRVAMGAAEAGMFPSAYALFADWVPAAERSRAVGLLFSAIPLATLATLALSGILTAAFGWSSVFYAFGPIGLAFALVWYRLVPETPGRVVAKRSEPAARAAADGPRSNNAMPWLRFVTRAPVWALIANSFATSWSIYVLLSWTPLYLSDVHDVTIAKAGLLSALPWIVMFLMINVAGVVADRLIARGRPLLQVRKAMQAGGLGGTAAFLLLMPGAETPGMAISLMCGALGANALTMAGFAPNHLELAPRAAAQLNSLTNLAGTLPGVIGVFATGWLVEVTGSYDTAFVFAAAVSLAGAGIWLRWASCEPIDDATADHH